MASLKGIHGILLSTLAIVCISTSSKAVKLEEFYPFGSFYGDKQVPRGVNTSSTAIRLTVPFHYFDEKHEVLFVNTDGILTFNGPIPDFNTLVKKGKLLINTPVIAPFYCNVETTQSGKVLYREETSSEVLERASHDVRAAFAKERSFNATSVFITTWYKVGHPNNKHNRENSYQAVLITDGSKSFTIFLYAKYGLQWTIGEKKSQNWRKYDSHAQAGFTAGDFSRIFKLPGSGNKDVRKLMHKSNINDGGKWMFKVSWPEMRMHNIQTADSYSLKSPVNKRTSEFLGCHVASKKLLSMDPVLEDAQLTVKLCVTMCHMKGLSTALLHSGTKCLCLDSEDVSYLPDADKAECDLNCPGNKKENCGGVLRLAAYDAKEFTLSDEDTSETDDDSETASSDIDECQTGLSLCDGQNAVCINKSPGYCCECKSEFYGNGISCLEKNVNQRLNGKISGTLNGVSFENIILQAYIVVKDGRVYTAMTSMPEQLKAYSLQPVISIGEIISWMFGVPESSDESSDVKNGMSLTGGDFTRTATIRFDSGEVMTIKQKFSGKDDIGSFASITELNGNFPRLKPQSKVTINPYTEHFKYTRKGALQTSSTRIYKVDGALKKYSISQTIEYNDPLFCPHQQDMFLKVERILVLYEEEKMILRHATTSKISLTSGSLKDKQCGPRFLKGCGDFAVCVDQGTTKECQCLSGYEGNGINCIDINECVRGLSQCHNNADCENTPGAYLCKCHSGYNGNGFKCTPVVTGCGPDNVQCSLFGSCITTSPGFQNCQCNTGYTGDGVSCEDIDECAQSFCDNNADCSNSEGAYKCTCRDGYSGNGRTCTEDDSSLCGGVPCDVNAECTNYDGNKRCLCKSGFYGNGVTCTDIDECAKSECDANAKCYNTPGSYYCSCNSGYEGDGKSCTIPGTCDGKNCDANADCITQNEISSCVCNAGFRGNGEKCQDINECIEGANNCDRNAECINNEGSFSCKCNNGYKGDGTNCEVAGGCGGAQCHSNGECRISGGRQRCVCSSGYQGDGVFCIDLNECETGLHRCNNNARCQNSYGSYKCFCQAGYTGDGFSCDSDGTCGGRRCNRNAECVITAQRTQDCSCKAGYTGNGLYCEDVDECKTSSLYTCVVNSECVNVIGGYKCECVEGYIWNGQECEASCGRCFNGGTCVGESECQCPVGFTGPKCEWASGDFLLYTQGNTVQRMPLPYQKNKVGKLYSQDDVVFVGVDYDCKNQHIYWSEVTSGAILRCKYDGTSVEYVISKGLGSPEGIAVDWISGNIYWTDSWLDRIEVARLDGSFRKLLFKTRLINPRPIALHVEQGMMYWADWNRASPKIEAASMDGSSRRVLVNSDMRLPNGLTIDRSGSQLCWTDAGYNSISCIALDGQNRHEIFAPAKYPFGITNYGLTMFYTDWNTTTIEEVEKNSNSHMKSILPYPGSHGKLFGITIVRSSGCPSVSNGCSQSNGGCSHMCLPKPGGFTCACPDMFLQDAGDGTKVCVIEESSGLQ